ncbi:hypothetical protein KVT40_004458 [Elsinoe batatas]|uniref:Cytochrome P450 n=1 Tax=Elsinoe batatas TaxID=2601811 RepID=A0A8K0L6V9_9PEZI|nr:hypothetical protein KVT40_004458 [Elsinoe batatas]
MPALNETQIHISIYLRARLRTTSAKQAQRTSLSIEIPTYGFHRDERLYPNADTFDVCRFYDMSAAGAAGKHAYVTARPEFLGWGLGSQVCPGRFLADVEMKLVLAYVVTNYELKYPEGKDRAVGMAIGNNVSDGSACTIARRRCAD